jgi:hypothetical protein
MQHRYKIFQKETRFEYLSLSSFNDRENGRGQLVKIYPGPQGKITSIIKIGQNFNFQGQTLFQNMANPCNTQGLVLKMKFLNLPN